MATTTGPNMGVLIGAPQGDAHYSEMLKFLRAFDGFAQPVVQAQQNSPPGSPSDGDMYVVGSSPSGAWTGHANAVARYYSDGAVWEYFTPRHGWQVFNASSDSGLYFDGSTWRSTATSAPPKVTYSVDHILTVSDLDGKLIIMQGSTILVPDSIHEAISTGARCLINNDRTSDIQIRPGTYSSGAVSIRYGGTTITEFSGIPYFLVPSGGTVTLEKTGTDSWFIY